DRVERLGTQHLGDFRDKIELRPGQCFQRAQRRRVELALAVGDGVGHAEDHVPERDVEQILSNSHKFLLGLFLYGAGLASPLISTWSCLLSSPAKFRGGMSGAPRGGLSVTGPMKPTSGCPASACAGLSSIRMIGPVRVTIKISPPRRRTNSCSSRDESSEYSP